MVVTVNGCSTRVVAPTLIRDRSFTVASVFKSEPTPSPHLMFNSRTSSRDHTFDTPGMLAGLFVGAASTSRPRSDARVARRRAVTQSAAMSRWLPESIAGVPTTNAAASVTTAYDAVVRVIERKL